MPLSTRQKDLRFSTIALILGCMKMTINLSFHKIVKGGRAYASSAPTSRDMGVR